MSRPRSIGMLLVLASLSAAPVLSRRAGVTDGPPPAGPVPGAHLSTSNGRQGFGVELQVMNLHLELAWFESVPVSPGRSLVLSWLARSPRGE